MYKYPEYIKKYLGYLEMIFIKYVFSLNCSSIDIDVNWPHNCVENFLKMFI